MAIPPVNNSTNVELNNSTGANSTGTNATLNAHAKIDAAPGLPKQNSEAFQQVNQQLSKNTPNAPNQNNGGAHGNSEGNQGQGNSAHAALQGDANVAPRGNGNHYGHQNRGSSDAPQNNGNQGNGNAYGHHKNDGGQPNPPNSLNINIDFSTGNQTSGNNRTGNGNQTGQHNQSTSPGNQTGSNNQTSNNNQTGNSNQASGNNQTTARGHLNYSAPPASRTQSSSLNLNLNLNLSLGNSNNGNHNGIVRSVLNNVLRQNDIYLNQNVIRHFVNETVAKTAHDNGNHYGSRQNVSIPPAVTQIVQTIKTQIVSVLNNVPAHFNHGHIRVTIQNSPELASLIQTSKNVLHQNFGAKQFINLNLHARMHIAAEMILHNLHNLPTSPQHILRNQSSKQIFNALLLACGFAVSADKFASLRNIFDAKKYPLPFQVPPVVIRNLGHAVKALMVEARLAETPADLEAAVQKFVRVLSGKNNLEALASAVKLAEHLGAKTGAEAKLPVPDEIANLVKYLILAGDKALQSVADAFDMAEGEMLSPKNTANPADAADIDRDLGRIWASDSPAEAESALRRQLDINPFFLNDRAASAFDTPSEAARAQEEFTNRYRHEIDQWLQSGNHRFVKDLELDKPVGIVVVRGTSGYFTADRARIVLVRDGSVQGWHFLKSFLVK
jgi:hypothetical protein